MLVLGDVSSTGIYELGISVDLGQLLALSGGPSLSRSTGERTTSSETTVRLFRKTAGRRDLVYEAPLELLLSEPSLYPPLQDSDVFTVETIIHERRRFSFRDALSIVSSFSTIVLIYDRLSR